MKKRRVRRHVTLIEIMIVIVLIGIIGSVVAYNLRGGLDKGKIFKTEAGGSQVYNILVLEMAKGTSDVHSVAKQWEKIIRESTLVKKPDDLMKDGWGTKYKVFVENDDLCVKSEKYTAQMQAQNPKLSVKDTYLR